MSSTYPQIDRSGSGSRGSSCSPLHQRTMWRPKKEMKQIEIMMSMQSPEPLHHRVLVESNDHMKENRSLRQQRMSIACKSLSSRDLLVRDNNKSDPKRDISDEPVKYAVSLKYDYTSKLIQTLLRLDFDDIDSILKVYPAIPRTASRTTGESYTSIIPKHILGYSTNFKYVHRKIMEFSLLSENGRQREHERWKNLPVWEKDMYMEQAIEIMNQRKMLASSRVSSMKTDGQESDTNGQHPERSSPTREKTKVRSKSDNVNQLATAIVEATRNGAQGHSSKSSHRRSASTSGSYSPNSQLSPKRKLRRRRSSDPSAVSDAASTAVASNKKKEVSRRAPKKRQLPALPASVWTYHILPLLGDRQSWNAVTSTCKEIRHSIQSGDVDTTLSPPWPDETVLGRTTNVRSVSFAANGAFIAFPSTVGGGRNGCIQVIDRKFGRSKPLLLSSSTSYCCSFSPVGKVLACTDKNSIILWEINGKSKETPNKIINRLSCPTDSPTKITNKKKPTCLAFSPDGAVLAAAFRDEEDNQEENGNRSFEIHFWNVSSDKANGCGRYIIGVQSMIGIVSLAFSPDGQTMAGATKKNSVQNAANNQGAIFVWDVSSVTNAESSQRKTIVPMIHPLLHEHGITGISYSRDGRFLASSHTSGCIVLWGVADNYNYAGEYVASKTGTIATSLAFSPASVGCRQANPSKGSPNLVCGKSDGTIKALNLDTNKSTIVHQGISRVKSKKTKSDMAIEGVTFSPDGRTMVFTTNDGVVHLSKLNCPI